MGIITTMRRQKAVYWSLAPGGDKDQVDEFGNPIINLTPIEIDVRWEDVSIEFVGANGTNEISRARVYVDRDVEVGGVLMLGIIANITDSVIPKENTNAWEIRRFEKLPNIKNTEQLRTVFL